MSAPGSLSPSPPAFPILSSGPSEVRPGSAGARQASFQLAPEPRRVHLHPSRARAHFTDGKTRQRGKPRISQPRNLWSPNLLRFLHLTLTAPPLRRRWPSPNLSNQGAPPARRSEDRRPLRRGPRAARPRPAPCGPHCACAARGRRGVGQIPVPCNFQVSGKPRPEAAAGRLLPGPGESRERRPPPPPAARDPRRRAPNSRCSRRTCASWPQLPGRRGLAEERASRAGSTSAARCPASSAQPAGLALSSGAAAGSAAAKRPCERSSRSRPSADRPRSRPGAPRASEAAGWCPG